MLFSTKSLSTALLSIILLNASAQSSFKRDDGESDTKRSKVSIEGFEYVPVKMEPVDHEVAMVEVPTLLTYESIKTDLKRINPVDPLTRKRPDENCLLCCVSFLNWVNSGVLKPAPAVNPDKPNIYMRSQGALLLDEEAAAAIPGHAVEIVIQEERHDNDDLEVLAYVDPKEPKIISFDPCELSDLDRTLDDLALTPVPGGACVTGLLCLGYHSNDLDKVKTDKGLEGHFINFYIYEKDGVKKILIVDPQTAEVRTLSTFLKKERSIYKDTAFVWWDSNKKAWAEPLPSIKNEPQEQGAAEVDLQPNLIKSEAERLEEQIRSYGLFSEQDQHLLKLLSYGLYLVFDRKFQDTYGDHIAPDQIFSWMEEMVRKGNANSLQPLFNTYWNASMHNPSPISARMGQLGQDWLKKAAHQGDLVAVNSLKAFYEEKLKTTTYEERRNWQVCLGQLHATNFPGCPADYNLAGVLIQRAAKQGNAVAQRCLGEFYEKGLIGEGPVRKMATHFYTQAVNQGDAIATRLLGLLNEKRSPNNPYYLLSVISYFKKAIELGDEESKEHLERIKAKIEQLKARKF